MNTLCVLVFVASAIAVSQATICKTDADCASNECCYIKPQFMVVSKRQIAMPVPTVSDTGVCESYHMQDEHCYPLETANGHCGCVSGTSCQWVAEPTTMSTGKRSMIYHPGPGSYKCA
ncbi:hypothetical protein ACF0H5_009710 [Mactra antiquata]